MSDDRARLLARLKALLAMTVENGCTEQEAMAAAAKASQLMQEHDLTMTAEQVKGDKYGARRRPLNGHTEIAFDHEIRFCAGAIGKFFDCKSWTETSPVGLPTQLVFFGSEHDTDAAHNMADLIRYCMECELVGYAAQARTGGRFTTFRQMRKAFMMGMAGRIAERLRDMRAAREQHVQKHNGGSQALVVVEKSSTVMAKYDAYLAKKNMRMRKGRRQSIKDGAAYGAGRAAGDNVNFSKNVGQSGPLQIGRG